MNKYGRGIASGKFGELLQGALPGEFGNNFLISTPINRYSTVKFALLSDKAEQNSIYPPHKIKSALVVHKLIDYFGISNPWQLELSSNIHEGKGLGSSTADIVACARAVTHALGKQLPITQLLAFIKNIEPSDGIMYDGIVCFYHRQVLLHSQFPGIANLVIAGIDEGGIIDTVQFNQESKSYSLAEKKIYAKLLEKILPAIKNCDLNTIGSVSTQSALLHQTINPKKNLDYLLEICQTIKAVGVIVAHSGTYAGIILNKDHAEYIQQLTYIRDQLAQRALVMEIFHTVATTSLTLTPNYV